MPIFSEFQDDIFRVKIVGNFAAGELLEAFLAGFADPRFTASTAIFVDARLSSANPSGKDVSRSSERIAASRPIGHSGKWAIVTSTTPVRFGLGRMAALTMESIGVPMAVFTEMDAALEYLGS